MRMLLSSAGVRSGVVRDALVSLLEAPPAESSIAVVIDAMLPFPGDKGTMLDDLDRCRALGWKQFDVLSLFCGPRSVIESRLRSADVIFCYGGSNHWLSHAWTETGLAPLLEELLEQKVYLGLSAGSMIFSRLHSAAVNAFDDQDEVDMLELPAVGPALPLFDWFVMPHLGASYFPEQTDAWAAAGAVRLGGPVWFIDDDSALLVRDLSADPEVVSAGHWLRFDEAGRLIASA
jgi:dipeptidase E